MTSPCAVGRLGLVRLALRRALSPATAALSALVLAPFVAWSLGADAGVSSALERAVGAEALDDLRRHAARQGLWTVALAWFLPLFVVHAARTVARLSGEDRAWRASRPAGPTAHVVAGHAGVVAGLALALVLAATAVELAVAAAHDGAAHGAWRDAGPLAGPDAHRIGAGERVVWRLDDPGPGAHVATVDVRTAGGPWLDVAWSARDRAGVERVHGRRTLELPLEGGRGPIAIELAARDGDATGALGFVTRDGPDGPRLWRAAGGDERLASLGLLARALLAGAAWTALALGFGAWVGAGSAAALALALAAATVLGDAPSWVPGAALPRALEVAGLGRIPAALDAGELATAAGTVVAGLLLAAVGLRGWRSAP